MLRKLKQREVKNVREEMLETIDTCCLCKRSLNEKRPVLDHCHTTGLVRSVICLNCNSMLGKCENAAIRCRGKSGIVEWLQNVASYVTHHQNNPSVLIHPTHKS